MNVTNTNVTESYELETTESNCVSSEDITESVFESEAETETIEEIGVETFPEGNANWQNSLYTLPMMGKGMLGIFLVTIIIVASVAILNRVTSGKKKEQ